MSAKLVVELDNGETFDASAEDVAKFGYVDAHAAYQRFCDWLKDVHPEIGARLTSSPLNPFRYAAECALMYPHMPDEETRQAARDLLAAALQLHLISEHKVGGFADDPFELHQHEHDGPGTIRNHDRHEAGFDTATVRQVLTED